MTDLCFLLDWQCVLLSFGSGSLVGPESSSFPPIWSCLFSISSSPQPLPSEVRVNINASASCFGPRCSSFWLMLGSSCSSLICWGSGSCWSTLELSCFMSCGLMSTTSIWTFCGRISEGRGDFFKKHLKNHTATSNRTSICRRQKYFQEN